MTAKTMIDLTVDTLSLQAAIKAVLQKMLSASPELLLDIQQRFLDGPEALEQFVRVNADPTPTAFAGVIAVRLEPSDRLLGLVAALGAGNAD